MSEYSLSELGGFKSKPYCTYKDVETPRGREICLRPSRLEGAELEFSFGSLLSLSLILVCSDTSSWGLMSSFKDNM